MFETHNVENSFFNGAIRFENRKYLALSIVINVLLTLRTVKGKFISKKFLPVSS